MHDSASVWPLGVRYAFLVAEDVSDRLLAAFPELQVSRSPGVYTTLFGPVRNRTELQGLLARFDTLGLTVIEMRRLPD